MIREATDSTRNETNKYLIRLTSRECDHSDAWEFCREAEYLGGIKTAGGFAFPSATRRAVALEMLGEKYGSRYFENVDGDGTDRKPRLLIAESDRDLNENYQSFFARIGYRVETAADGLQCMRRARQWKPDLLVLEYELPWGGGDGVLARMREEHDLLGISVVLITCDRPVNELSDELVPPVVGCLRKPFRMSELVKILHTVAETQPRRPVEPA